LACEVPRGTSDDHRLACEEHWLGTDPSRWANEDNAFGCTLRRVADDEVSSTHEAIRLLFEDQSMRARLMRHAYARCHSVTDAKDIVQEAIKKVLEGASPWRREKCPLLIDHLGSVINTVAWNQSQSAAARHETEYDPALWDRVVDGAPNPEQILVEREAERAQTRLVERCLAALRMALHGDNVALAVVDLFEQGVESAQEQAEAAGIARDEIDKARRRVGYHADIVIRAERGGERAAVAQPQEVAS
jgi:DNA-directed RNA polymerase specialized sigma24 family protein